MGGQPHASAALPPGKTRYPLYRRLGGPQGRSGRVRKISPPPWFDPRTVHPVASSYTEYAIPAPIRTPYLWKLFEIQIWRERVTCTVTCPVSRVIQTRETGHVTVEGALRSRMFVFVSVFKPMKASESVNNTLRRNRSNHCVFADGYGWAIYTRIHKRTVSYQYFSRRPNDTVYSGGSVPMYPVN